MALERMQQSQTSLNGSGSTALSLMLCAGLFLTSFVFDGALPNFVLISISLIVFYRIIEFILRPDESSDDTVRYSAVEGGTAVDSDMAVKDGAAVVSSKDNEVGVGNEKAHSTLELHTSNSWREKPSNLTFRTFINYATYFSSASIVAMCSQELASGCFAARNSSNALLTVSVVGVAGALVAGAYQYLPERLRQVFNKACCLASILGVICWIATTAPPDANSEPSRLVGEKTLISTSIASAALALYTTGSLGPVVHIPGVCRPGWRRILCMSLCLFVAHCLTSFATYLASTVSFYDLLTSSNLSGRAVAARVLWTAGLIGPIASLMATFNSFTGEAIVSRRTQLRNALWSMSPPLLAMLARCALNMGNYYILLGASVQLTGGLVMPTAALILPLMSVSAKKIKRCLLMGVAGCYLCASTVMFILALAPSIEIGRSIKDLIDRDARIIPDLPLTSYMPPFKQNDNSLYPGINRTSENATLPEETNFVFDVKQPLYIHHRDHCNLYSHVIQDMRTHSYCGIEPIETLFTHCQLMYYHPKIPVAVFRHPRIGFIAMFNLRQAQAFLNKDSDPQDRKFIKRATADKIAYLDEEQPMAIVRLLAFSSISHLFETHRNVTSLSGIFREEAICTVFYQNNVCHVLLQPRSHAAILYALTDKPNGVVKVDTASLLVGKQCIPQYEAQLNLQTNCSDVLKTLSKTCLLLEEVGDTFSFAFRYEKPEWMLQSVNLSQILQQNNLTMLGREKLPLTDVHPLNLGNKMHGNNSKEMHLIYNALRAIIWERGKSPELSACRISLKTQYSMDIIVSLTNKHIYRITISSEDNDSKQLNISISNVTFVESGNSKSVPPITSSNAPVSTEPSTSEPNNSITLSNAPVSTEPSTSEPTYPITSSNAPVSTELPTGEPNSNDTVPPSSSTALQPFTDE